MWFSAFLSKAFSSSFLCVGLQMHLYLSSSQNSPSLVTHLYFLPIWMLTNVKKHQVETTSWIITHNIDLVPFIFLTLCQPLYHDTWIQRNCPFQISNKPYLFLSIPTLIASLCPLLLINFSVKMIKIIIRKKKSSCFETFGLFHSASVRDLDLRGHWVDSFMTSWSDYLYIFLWSKLATMRTIVWIWIIVIRGAAGQGPYLCKISQSMIYSS